MDMKLKGSVSIHRRSGGGEMAIIQVTDEASGAQAIEIEMTIADFGAALMNLSHRPCEVTYRTSRLGTTREHKTEIVPFDMHKDKGREDEALALFEVDGWRGSRRDMQNRHRRTSAGQRVLFERWVPTDNPSGSGIPT